MRRVTRRLRPLSIGLERDWLGSRRCDGNGASVPLDRQRLGRFQSPHDGIAEALLLPPWQIAYHAVCCRRWVVTPSLIETVGAGETIGGRSATAAAEPIAAPVVLNVKDIAVASIDDGFIREGSRLSVIAAHQAACPTHANLRIRRGFGPGITGKSHDQVAPTLSTRDPFSDGPLRLVDGPILRALCQTQAAARDDNREEGQDGCTRAAVYQRTRCKAFLDYSPIT